MQTINVIRKKCNANVIDGQETRTFWRTVTEELGEEFQFNELLAVGEPRNSVVGYNIHEDWDHYQPGGTAAMATGRLLNYVLECEPDKTGLGRWVHIALRTPEKKVHLIEMFKHDRC